MARLTLRERATRYGALARRETTGMSKKDLNERRKLVRAIGIPESKWDSYAASTRRKYLAAARRGNTAQQERARVRGVRQRKRGIGVVKGPTRSQINQQVAEARELINLIAGPDTDYDKNVPHHEDLLSDDSITDFINYYGPQYVSDRLNQVIDSVNKFYRGDRSVGRRRFFDFEASEASEIQDERWWWYHGGSFHIV